MKLNCCCWREEIISVRTVCIILAALASWPRSSGPRLQCCIIIAGWPKELYSDWKLR